MDRVALPAEVRRGRGDAKLRGLQETQGLPIPAVEAESFPLRVAHHYPDLARMAL